MPMMSLLPLVITVLVKRAPHTCLLLRARERAKTHRERCLPFRVSRASPLPFFFRQQRAMFVEDRNRCRDEGRTVRGRPHATSERHPNRRGYETNYCLERRILSKSRPGCGLGKDPTRERRKLISRVISLTSSACSFCAAPRAPALATSCSLVSSSGDTTTGCRCMAPCRNLTSAVLFFFSASSSAVEPVWSLACMSHLMAAQRRGVAVSLSPHGAERRRAARTDRTASQRTRTLSWPHNTPSAPWSPTPSLHRSLYQLGNP